MPRGIFGGPKTPAHCRAVTAGAPASAMVGTCGHRRGHRAVRAWPVLDDDRLSELLRERGAGDARRGIG